MNILHFIFIIIFVYVDLRFLKRLYPDRFASTFHVSLKNLAIFILVAQSLLWLAFRGGLSFEPENIGIFYLSVFGVGYVVKRYRLMHGIKNKSKGRIRFVSDAIGVVFAWFLIMLAISAVIKVVRFEDSPQAPSLEQSVMLSGLSLFVFLGVIVRSIKKDYQLSVKEVFALPGKRCSVFTVFVWPVLLGIVFAVFSGWILLFREHHPVTPFSEVMESTASVNVILLFIMLAIFVAPLLEEIIFRGYFFYVLSRFRNPQLAAGIVTFLFAVLHYEQYWPDGQAIVIVTLLSFSLTMLRLKSQSCIPSIVMHYVYNISMTIIPIVFLLITNPYYFAYQANFELLEYRVQVDLLTKSIESNPDFPLAYNDLAWLYAKENKNLEDALKLVDKALKMSPGRYAFLDTKAEVLYKLGRTAEAIEIAESLVERYPDREHIHNQMKKFQQNN